MPEGHVAPGKGCPQAAACGYKVWTAWETVNSPNALACGTWEAHSARNGWKSHIVEDLEGRWLPETSMGLEHGKGMISLSTTRLSKFVYDF